MNLINLIKNNSYQDVFNLVKDKNAEIDYVDSNDESPIMVACKYGYNQIALLLLSLHVNVNIIEPNTLMTPLIYACINNMVEVVDNILSYPFSDYHLKKKYLEHKNVHGNNALISSCFNACYQIIPMLLNSGCNVNSKNNNSMTPVSAIMMFNSIYREEILELLIEKGALVNISNNQGISPLDLAWRSKDNHNVTKMLLYQGGAKPGSNLVLDKDFAKFISECKLDKI